MIGRLGVVIEEKCLRVPSRVMEVLGWMLLLLTNCYCIVGGLHLTLTGDFVLHCRFLHYISHGGLIV